MGDRARRLAGLRLGAGLVAVALGAFGVRGMLAQTPQPVPPLPKPVNASTDPLLKAFVWREIGPANIGGRIDDIAVVESNPSIIYVGFATGGIWKSVNNGTTWTPIFDEYPVSSIGDIAIAPSNPDILYVGTGEANNRQSSSFGAGVYKSIDGGKTFVPVGLEKTQSIARIVVHPKNPDIAYVAARRAISSVRIPSAACTRRRTAARRGRTRNSSTTTPASPTSSWIRRIPTRLYAASYQRRRMPWGFNGAGPGSGIWKTTNGGKSWTKLTGNGLPTNPVIGRIGLDLARSKPQTIYASIEVGPSGGTGAGVNEDGTLQPPGQRGAGGGEGRGGRGAAISHRPIRPSPASGARTTAERRGDFSSNSMDRPMYYSQIRVDPNNPDIAYQGGAPFFKTTDGGKSWQQVRASRTRTITRSGSIRRTAII